LPIDVYETALNVTLSSLLQPKVDHDGLDLLPLCTFSAELTNLIYSVLQNGSAFYLVDCYVSLNPQFNENEHEDRSIIEMQPTIFEQNLYEFRPDGKMISEGGQGKQISDPSLIFKKAAIVEHVQQLRTQTYSILGLCFGEQEPEVVRNFCLTRFKHLAKMLIKDVMHLPKMYKANRREPADCDTELNNEAIELFVKLMAKDKQLLAQFESQGASSEFVETLRVTIQEYDLGYEESKAVNELHLI
jgi:hypothetical protein